MRGDRPNSFQTVPVRSSSSFKNGEFHCTRVPIKYRRCRMKTEQKTENRKQKTLRERSGIVVPRDDGSRVYSCSAVDML